jgi:hypothetical protein
MYWILILAGVCVLALLFWPKWKAWLPSSVSTAVTTAIGQASSVVSDAAADAALQSLAVLAWTHDDLATIAKLAEVKAAIQKWQAKPAPLPPVVNVEALAADIAILRSVMASQLTNTIPKSAVQTC